jgi:predicted nucleotidyltransferase
VVLFGSLARSEAARDSDLDPLTVLDDDTRKERTLEPQTLELQTLEPQTLEPQTLEPQMNADERR